MRALSPVFLAALHGQESGEVLLPLVKLAHTSWPDSLRFVPDWQEITHGGEIYSLLSPEIALPDDEAEGLPVLRWQADAVSQELIQRLRQVTDPIAARVVWVLASQPDTVEAGPFELEIRAADYDATTVRGTMGVEPILDAPFSAKAMTPKTCPGLF